MFRLRILACCLLAGPVALVTAPPLVAPALSQEIDTDTGLTIGEGWQVVRERCLRCHSGQLIVQNSGSREVWQSRVLTMQQSHGMEALSAELEAIILDYLETHYGPREASRRPPLPAHLLPPASTESSRGGR